jgi:hypothetical protein
VEINLKILLLDIETAPSLAYVFQYWNQNISIDKVEVPDYMLCWAAKWYKDDTIYTGDIQHGTSKQMLKELHKLLNEADAVVHFNGKKFDIPWINRELILAGYAPPSPFKEIDLVETAKKKFRFPSNKLAFLLRMFGLGEKDEMTFEDWRGCIKGDVPTWKKMIKYNINDVTKLEELYVVFLPWIKGHANHSMFTTDKLVCPRCGSEHVHSRGTTNTNASIFQRYQCVKKQGGCGGWFKDNVRLNTRKYKTSEIL